MISNEDIPAVGKAFFLKLYHDASKFELFRWSQLFLKYSSFQQTNNQSDGFFITQDSNFGNLIMSVIPRFNPDGTLAAGNKPRTL